MVGFLEEVAADLYSRYGANVGDVKLLLPSRRARVFFTDALSRITEQPIWQPKWVVIDQLMSSAAGVDVADKVRLIAELFTIYHKHHPHETLDKFYFWGEVLLSDFDMVDKYLIDADMLFRNISDIKEIETDLSYLTPQQLQVLSFWRSIESSNPEQLSKEKRNFLKVWRSLRPIYHQFRERLLSQGIAYSGMAQRLAAERLKRGDIAGIEFLKGDKREFAAVGFNALNECEKALFDKLKSECGALFYWDWDNYYVANSEQEAGLFIRDNRVQYPSANNPSHDNFAEEKEIEVVACSSSSLQCKYINNILDSIGTVDERTAIVLTDENLLLPLLYALPPSDERHSGVNVTMGYPLRHSLAYSFVERLLELQSHIRVERSGDISLYYKDVVGLLSHPYIAMLIDGQQREKITQRIHKERLIRITTKSLSEDIDSDIIATIFSNATKWQELSHYLRNVIELILSTIERDDDEEQPTRRAISLQDEVEQRIEFLSYIETELTKLHNSVERCDIELNMGIYISLLRRHLQPLKIPFEGEPLEGLQVMGILESRTLDFDNVILLSMNDDNFPGNKTTTPSYIPYNLRAAYEIPTAEHHDGVYAYYFYRLIQRAKRVWMLYSSVADDKSTGEQSRYISQLDYESPHDINRIDVGVDVNLFEAHPIEIEKRGRIVEQLREYITPTDDKRRSLAPTTLCKYADCPLKFYYKALARINSQDDDISEDVDAPMFGNILHIAMQELYKDFEGKGIALPRLQKIEEQEIQRAVDYAIKSSYFSGKDITTHDYSGDIVVAREVVLNYIRDGILRYDKSSEPFEIIGIESYCSHTVEFGDSLAVQIGGVCDRIDHMADGSVRIVDYKSGGKHLEFESIESLFKGSKVPTEYIFQTMLYSLMLLESDNAKGDITPALYFAREMNKHDFEPLLYNVTRDESVVRYNDYHTEFATKLREMLTELFDESIPFRQAEDSEVCKFCDYAPLCRR